MTLEQIRQVVAAIAYKPGWTLRVDVLHENYEGERTVVLNGNFEGERIAMRARAFLHVVYNGSGDYGRDRWTSRKWVLSEFMTETEVVHTAFKAVMAAEEHETREVFKYEDVEVCGPHYAVRDLVTLVKLKRLGYDTRPDAMQGAR